MNRALGIACGATLAVLLAGWLVVPRHEVSLTVPAELQGAVVFADNQQVAVVEEPELILMRFWLPKHELRVVKPGYQPIVLALRADGKNYPLVTKAELLLTKPPSPPDPNK